MVQSALKNVGPQSLRAFYERETPQGFDGVAVAV